MFEQSSVQALAVIKALWDTQFVRFVFSILALAAGFSGPQVFEYLKPLQINGAPSRSLFHWMCQEVAAPPRAAGAVPVL